ncbi:MAG: hypothetical protein JKY52_15215 [Flavobacteriales bacterium]|nr:hypothetical protein [Flavobacteriales bacterium]
MKKSIIILLAFFVGLQSCETEFEVNAPWKDITSVYGLLNQNEAVHLIKINKAFLGETAADELAEIRDSSEYKPDEITAQVEKILNGSVKATYALNRVTLTNKPSGTFYSPEHVMYQFIDSNLQEGFDYKLTITKTATQEKVTAETELISDFDFWEPNWWNGPKKVSFFCQGGYQSFNKAEWKSAVNGRRYQLTIRFNYIEKDVISGNETFKFVDWVFPAVQSPDLDGGDRMGSEIDGEDFYKFIGNKLTPVSSSNNVVRCIGELDFTVDVAAEDFNTYMQVNEPTTGVVQERAEFSNVFDEKGNQQVGFFSARFAINETGAQLSKSCNGGNAVTELKTGPHTGNLGFINKEDDSTCPL